MATSGVEDLSGLLRAWSNGDGEALRELAKLVYPDLRGIARRQLRCHAGGRIASSGTLVHEAYMKLAHSRGIQCENRAHFFALCAQVIRRILVDQVRGRGRGKRGGGQTPLSLDEVDLLGKKARGVDVEALDEALTTLAKIDPRKSRVVELRFFGGLTMEETADVLEISEETVLRDWRVAKTWLFRGLKNRGG